MSQTVLQAIQLAYVAMPWVLAFGIPLLAILALVVGRRTAGWWVGAYFMLLFYIPNASWGLIDQSSNENFYARGTGTFFFSAINVLLFGLAIQAFFARRFAAPLPVRHNLGVPALLFGLVLLGNLVVFVATPNLRWFQLLAPSGLLQAVNFMLGFYVLVNALREPDDLRRFINLLLFCAVTRGLWGLVRFVALGGDPANFYDNFQHLDVKLTFFDVNDSLVALLALFVVVWRLATGQVRAFWPKVGCWAVVGLELFIIVFSYRRIAWGGLALAALLLAISLRGRWRWGLLGSFALFGLPLLAYKASQRAGKAAGGSWLERLLPDVVQGGQFSFTTGRFAELYAAWLTIKDDWLLGLGAWGRYDGFRFGELAWHRGDFGWMHSGVLHIALKAGLVGVLIMLAVGVLYVRFVRGHQSRLPAGPRGVVLAGAAGMLFMVPTMLVGTPLIEFRSMQLLALCLALPYLAWAAAQPALPAGSPVPLQGGVVRQPRAFGIAKVQWRHQG
jgi:hypothetical protein